MTVLRSEARAVLQWCLNQPGWWRTRDVSDDLGYSLDAARKQMLRLDELNLIERGALNGRTPLWRIRDRDHSEMVANERPGPKKNGYKAKRKGRPEFVPPSDPDDAPITRQPPPLRQKSEQSITAKTTTHINSVWSLAQ